MNQPVLHRVRTGDGVQIALHRIPRATAADRPPVLLVPGTFSTRNFWLGSRGQGFAWAVAAAGWDTWIVELRGHGASDRPPRWTMNDWIRYDAPAALSRVLEEAGAVECFLVGHSAGGAVGAAVASDPAVARQLRGLVLLGAPGPGGLRGWRRSVTRGIHVLAGIAPRLRVPGALPGLGPEPEPAALIRSWMGWNLAGAWRDPGGRDYLEALAETEVPLLAVAGAGDHILAPPESVRDLVGRFGSPDRTLVVASVDAGFREDYDHAGLMIGSAARQEIWPLVLQWLESRVAPPTEGTGGVLHFQPPGEARDGTRGK